MHFFSDVVRVTRRGVLVGVAGALALAPVQAAVMGGAETAARSETEQGVAPLRMAPSALLTIDQHRSTVVERIVGEWALELAASSAGISAEELRTTLSAMRADDLLAASVVSLFSS